MTISITRFASAAVLAALLPFAAPALSQSTPPSFDQCQQGGGGFLPGPGGCVFPGQGGAGVMGGRPWAHQQVRPAVEAQVPNWLGKSAEQHLAEAQALIEMREFALALSKLGMAGSMGLAKADLLAAGIHWGDVPGTQRRPDMAIEKLWAAAAKGDGLALLLIGDLFASPEQVGVREEVGLPENRVAALALYRRALVNGSHDAEDRLTKLKASMSDEAFHAADVRLFKSDSAGRNIRDLVIELLGDSGGAAGSSNIGAIK